MADGWTLALTCFLSLRRGFYRTHFPLLGMPSANPAAGIAKGAEAGKPSPWGDLSHLGNDERNSVESRRPAGPSERERVSQRLGEGGCLTNDG